MADDSNGEGAGSQNNDDGSGGTGGNNAGAGQNTGVDERIGALETSIGSLADAMKGITERFKEEDEETKRKLDEAKTDKERLEELMNKYSDLEGKYGVLKTHVEKEVEAKNQQLLAEKTDIAKAIVKKNPTFTVDDLTRLDLDFLKKLDDTTLPPTHQSRWDGGKNDSKQETPEERHARLMKMRDENINRKFKK